MVSVWLIDSVSGTGEVVMMLSSFTHVVRCPTLASRCLRCLLPWSRPGVNWVLRTTLCIRLHLNRSSSLSPEPSTHHGKWNPSLWLVTFALVFHESTVIGSSCEWIWLDKSCFKELCLLGTESSNQLVLEWVLIGPILFYVVCDWLMLEDMYSLSDYGWCWKICIACLIMADVGRYV